MNKTYLITGGTGFIGSNIAKSLVANGQKVIIFDNNYRGSIKKIKDFRRKVKFVKGDIRNENDLKKAANGANVIIHLAYINGTKFFYSKPELVLEVAVKGILNVFEVCKKKRIKELFIASSSEVYQTPIKIPTKEEEMLKIPDVFNPRYSYGGGKILSELMGVNYGKKFFRKLIIFRPHNVYGPNMGNEHVIPEFISKMKKKNNHFKIEGTGEEIRSFIHIDDFIRAFQLILKKGKHLNIYNIGTNEKVKIKDLAKIVANIFSKKIKIKRSPLKKGGTKVRLPSINKIKKLGFKQKLTLKNGLRKLLSTS